MSDAECASESNSSVIAPPTTPDGWSRRLLAAALMLFAALVPVTIAGAQIAMGIVLVAWLVVTLRGSEPRRFVSDPLLPPLLAYLVVKVISYALSADPSHAFSAMRGEWILVTYVLLRQAVRTERIARRAIAAFIVSAGIVAIYAVWQAFDGWDYVRARPLVQEVGLWHSASGFFGNRLTYGGVTLIAFLAALTFAIHAGGRARKLYTSLAILTAGGIVASTARTAWVGAGAGVLVAAAFIGRRSLPLIAGGTVASLLTMLVSPGFRGRVLSVATLQELPRARLWLTSLRMSADRLLLGGGAGCFRPLFPEYRLPGRYPSTAHPHNDFLNQLVEIGVIGALVWIAIWVRVYQLILRAWNDADGAGRADRGLLVAGAACVAGFLAGGLGQCYFTDEEVAMAIWLVIACALTRVSVHRRATM